MRRPLAYFACAIVCLLHAGQARAYVVRLQIPVVWQLTRPHRLGLSAASMTESFRETWRLEWTASGLLNLVSPRASVPAYAAKVDGGDLMPRSMLVTEIDFARLVGAQPALADTLDENDSSIPQRVIVLHIGKPPRGGTDINLIWSEDEHFAVHFDNGTNALY